MRKHLPVGILLLMLGLAACQSRDRRAPVLGEAYADGRPRLFLRKDIPLQAPVVATARHGDRLEIIQHRRRFMKVRTPGGAEGWTEDHLLLSSHEVADLNVVEQRARTLPSQGLASTYELLNVHTEPDRFSPSFLQIKEGEKVDVVAHLLSPRAPSQPKSLLPAKPKTPPPAHKHTDAKYQPPPLPPAPPLPSNWLELSKTLPGGRHSIDRRGKSRGRAGAAQRRLEPGAQRPGPKRMGDHAAALHGHSRRCGAIRRRPSHHLVFFARRGAGRRCGEAPLALDHFRRRRSSVRLRQLPGFHLEPAPPSLRDRLHPTQSRGLFYLVACALLRHGSPAATTRAVPATPGSVEYPGFSVCLGNDDGARVRRNFAFISPIVRFAGQQPCENPGGMPCHRGPAAYGARVRRSRPPQLSLASSLYPPERRPRQFG